MVDLVIRVTYQQFMHLYIIYVVLEVDNYRKTSNIRPTSSGNQIVDQSDVVGASPVDAAPTTSSFST